MTANRIRLPGRRLAHHVNLTWGNLDWSLSMGFDSDGKVRELFANDLKVTSDLEAALDDACVLVSMMLQSGWSIADLLHSLGRQGVVPEAPAASMIGQAIRAAAEYEEQHGSEIAAGLAVMAGRDGSSPAVAAAPMFLNVQPPLIPSRCTDLMPAPL